MKLGFISFWYNELVLIFNLNWAEEPYSNLSIFIVAQKSIMEFYNLIYKSNMLVQAYNLNTIWLGVNSLFMYHV